MFINRAPTSKGLKLDKYELDHYSFMRFFEVFYDTMIDQSRTYYPTSLLLLTQIFIILLVFFMNIDMMNFET